MTTPDWAQSEVKKIDPEGNPLWPLPADFNELSSPSQRLARVNGCRQYLLDWGSPDRNANVFADCVEFFDRMYLLPIPEIDHFPGFYDLPPVPGAPFHRFMQYAYWRYGWQALVAPRGGTKSMQIRKRIMLRMTAERGFSCVYATATDTLAKITGTMLRKQFMRNKLLLEDWNDVYPDGSGRLAPKPRGDLPISTEIIELYNNSVCFFASANSRQRGRRPIVYELDDPEYDPESETTNMEGMRNRLEETILKIIGPMMTRSSSKYVWTGTFLSAQHLLWSAMDEEKLPDGTTTPRDKRFRAWKRFIIKAAQEDPQTGEPSRSNWPHMWPLSNKEKVELKLPEDTVTIPELRARFGEPVWQAEFQANPGAISGSYYPFNRTESECEQRFGYKILSADEYTFSEPFKSQSIVRWHKWRDGECLPVEFPLSELVQQCRPFITVDTAYSESATSDWKVAHVMMWTPDKELFSLDIHDTRRDETYLAQLLFELGNRWNAWAIFPEVTNTQRSLARTLQQRVVDRLPQQMGIGHVPAIMPLHTGRESKQSRLASFRVWFDLNKVKLPFDRMHSPVYNRLFNQLEGFSPELKDGGLRHDDHLDTLEMAQRTVKVSADKLERMLTEHNDRDPMELLKHGQTHDDKTGVAIASIINPFDYPLSDLMEAAYAVHSRKNRSSNESVA